ncbi:glycosyltransferase family 4 protein [Nostoc sp. FACHB-190]|uniref:glycosyltransferase family 4 protein n=1 Tax=Nostoc sp. FACHB-190 TaxID=2692838 RepID=UPI0016838E94|nr:glycosyltransferase family 4 protein [Nostoc sp. FACHB-190]MBD2297076.1 glycosyltransferase family 4 protein [Nostoc sp. FACHB-190]
MRIVHLSTIHQALDVRIFYKECQTLAKAGYEVHLLVPNPPAEQLEGVCFHAIDKVTNHPRLIRIWRRLSSAYKIAKSLQADVYHFHDPELIPVGIFLQRLGAKVIYDVHEDSPWEAISLSKNNLVLGWLRFSIWTILEGIAKAHLDAFICVTPHIAQKFPSAKMTVVANFPLIAELQAEGQINIANTEENIVIYAGGIAEIRGIRQMVEAMEFLPKSLTAKLLLLGEFSSLDMQNEVEKIPGWQQVEFLGWQSRQSVVQYLAKSKVGLVLFHPKRDHLEALPNKLFEYMAAGLPVVASNFALWREIIEDIGCGLVVNPLDCQEIAQSIQYLLENPEIAVAMGKRGREAVINRYNWDIESKKLLKLYTKIEIL